MNSVSAFCHARLGVQILKRPYKAPRPTRKERATFGGKARSLLDHNLAQFKAVLARDQFDLNWLREGYDFVIIGGTGNGLGYAIACALAEHLGEKNSITVLANDPENSFGRATAVEILNRYPELRSRVQFINHFMDTGIDVLPKSIWNRYPFLMRRLRDQDLKTGFSLIRDALSCVKARRLIYINALHWGFHGLGMDQTNHPFYVPDLKFDPKTGKASLVQYEMAPLSSSEDQLNLYVMGDLAVQFPQKLRLEGFGVVSENYFSFRGSMDAIAVDPQSPEYGRWLGWSGSISEPKATIHRYTEQSKEYDERTDVTTHILPIMRTDGLATVPGGTLMSHVFAKLAGQSATPYVDIPEIALQVLNRIGRNLHDPANHEKFPHYDGHETPFDSQAFEIFGEINCSPNSRYLFKHFLV